MKKIISFDQNPILTIEPVSERRILALIGDVIRHITGISFATPFFKLSNYLINADSPEDAIVKLDRIVNSSSKEAKKTFKPAKFGGRCELLTNAYLRLIELTSNQLLTVPLLNFVKQHLKKDDSVLELAAGNALFGSILMKSFIKKVYHGPPVKKWIATDKVLSKDSYDYYGVKQYDAKDAIREFTDCNVLFMSWIHVDNTAIFCDALRLFQGEKIILINGIACANFEKFFVECGFTKVDTLENIPNFGLNVGLTSTAEVWTRSLVVPNRTQLVECTIL